MATILPLPAPRSRTAPVTDPPAGATILFFTGIRYVRDEEWPDEAPAAEPDRTSIREFDETVALSLM